MTGWVLCQHKPPQLHHHAFRKKKWKKFCFTLLYGIKGINQSASAVISGQREKYIYLSLYIYIKYIIQFFHHFIGPQWSTTDSEIKIPSFEKPSLTNVLPLKPAGGQNIATHASPTAKNFSLVLISAFLVHLPLFFPNCLPIFLVSMWARRMKSPCS